LREAKKRRRRQLRLSSFPRAFLPGFLWPHLPRRAILAIICRTFNKNRCEERYSAIASAAVVATLLAYPALQTRIQMSGRKRSMADTIFEALRASTTIAPDNALICVPSGTSYAPEGLEWT